MQPSPATAYLEERACRYIRELTSGETPVMERVREECAEEGHPCITPEAGRALQLFCVALQAKRILEVGACVGYSTLWLAQGLTDGGCVDTIESDEALAETTRAHVREAGMEDRVNVLVGNALDVLPTLEGPYDLVFLDADKREYVDYLGHAVRLTRLRGIIAADNLLWHGRVMDPAHDDDDTNGIRRYTKSVLSSTNLVTTILPVGDGLGVSVLLP